MLWKNKKNIISDSGKTDINLDVLPLKSKRRVWKIFGVVFLTLFLLTSLVFGVSAAYIKKYQDKIYPGVYLSHFHLGGMSAEDVKGFLESLNNRLAKEGIVLLVEKKDGGEESVKINTVMGEEGAIELIEYKSLEAGNAALSVGRQGEWWERLFAPWKYLFFHHEISAPVLINVGHLTEYLKNSLSVFADAPNDANIKILNYTNGQYEIVPEKTGKDFVYSEIISFIEKNLSELSFSPIKIVPVVFSPTISSSEAASVSEFITKVFGYGGIGLNYIDPQTRLRRDWNLSAALLADWTKVKKDNSGQLIISLNTEELQKYLETLRREVDKTSQDAKFIVNNGVVKEFQASQSGLSLDAEKTMSDLLAAFEERNYRPAESVKTISLTVSVTEPNIKMSDTNNLGIEDILGVGISSFKGSSADRIKNIALAVKKVNGTLVLPGEQFSANRAAGPFTLENGYLPELVIKGNEIKKEVGGGMCQIGTTLFRMAMNSGMPITERRNHSLVVNYYADPVNGNPGTDATLYEPILDFKFLNDTGGHLLVQTAIDYNKQELYFTLWGKNDGRKGWYTHPVVSKWIPSGEPQEILTDKLKPGVRECQNAYRGAVASFTYSRITPVGEKIDRVFDSYYRPLPMICMVGSDPSAVSSTTPVDSPVLTPPSSTESLPLE